MSKLPVGIQVYGLRDLLEGTPENFKSVMESVKAMGYDGVELAGLYGLEPEYIHDILGEVGLKPLSAHVPLVEMMEDAEKAVQTYKTIGCDYMVVPYLPEELRPLHDGYEKALSEMRRIGKIVRDNGMKLLYHNHDFEFVTMPDGTFGFDDIYTQVPADLLMVEPDTCWIKVAGQDPAGYIDKYSDRCEIIHLKDFIKEGDPDDMYELIGIESRRESMKKGFFQFRPVGFGQQIWEPILEASLRSNAKWVVVEQDQHYELDALEAARRSREYLKILGW